MTSGKKIVKNISISQSLGRRLSLTAAVSALLFVSAPMAHATIITIGDVSPNVGPGNTTTLGNLTVDVVNQGSVDVNSQSILNVSNLLSIRNGSTLSVSSGGETNASSVTLVGNNNNGDGTLLIQGSQAGTTSTLNTNIFHLCGNNSGGRLEIRDGGVLNATAASNHTIGDNSTTGVTTGTQSALVTGAGITENFETSLLIGRGEQRQLDVENGGTVNVVTVPNGGLPFINIGSNNFSGVAGTGTVNVRGPGLTLNGGDSVGVGQLGGYGKLNVSNGGQVSAVSLNLAGGAGSTASVVVTGAGSAITTANVINAVTLQVGAQGTASLRRVSCRSC
jgi:T5SS/PEP-CTERM-associated repeat protein